MPRALTGRPVAETRTQREKRTMRSLAQQYADLDAILARAVERKKELKDALIPLIKKHGDVGKTQVVLESTENGETKITRVIFVSDTDSKRPTKGGLLTFFGVRKLEHLVHEYWKTIDAKVRQSLKVLHPTGTVPVVEPEEDE